MTDTWPFIAKPNASYLLEALKVMDRQLTLANKPATIRVNATQNQAADLMANIFMENPHF